MLTLFAIGTFWFWVLLAVHFCVLLALIEYEKVGWATISLIVAFAALHFLGDFNIVAAAIANPVGAAIVGGGYFVAGTAWSIVKWWFYVRRCREKYDELKAGFLRQNRVSGTAIPAGLKKDWLQVLRAHSFDWRKSCGYDPSESVIPKAGEHKGRIMTWMCYWPWSAVWTIINDPVKRLFKQIYLQIQGLLQSISNSAFKGVEDDLKEPPAPPAAPPADSSEGDWTDDASPVRSRRGGINTGT